MSSAKKLMGTTAVGGALAIEDVFSTYLYTGNGSTQTITNGIDLAGEGGMVWIKSRSDAVNHVIVDTERVSGTTDNYLMTNLTNAQVAHQNEFGNFTSTGFTVPYNTEAGYTNFGTRTYVSWTFRKAPRFFDVVTWTGDGTSGRTINHNLETTVGFVTAKITNATSGWLTHHKDLGFAIGDGLLLNTTDAIGSYYSPITASSDTTITILDGWNTSGQTYVAYLFAHDPLGPSGDGSDGMIACGSLALSGSAFFQEELGWEPQWVLWKMANGTGDWNIMDNMRPDFTATASGASATTKVLKPNSTASEAGNNLYMGPNSSGFGGYNLYAGTYIYIAIRRGPMRQPTSGTEVYSAGVVQNNTGRTLTNPLGYPSDMAFTQTSAGGDWIWQSRLTGKGGLFSNNNNAESTVYAYGFGNNTNYEADGTAAIGAYGWNFRRAPGFFDAVAYSGNGVAGRTVPHNLGVAPEFIIVKNRTYSGISWAVYHSAETAADAALLNSTNAFVADSTFWNNTEPTDSVFSIGTSATVNDNTSNYIAYLFATLLGVSKVGSYTGDGTTDHSNVINCGFTTGARFVLIKRSDGTGDWNVYDTARGMAASTTDPELQLNLTAAENSDYDLINTTSSGFSVSNIGGGINLSGINYIFLAIA